MSQPLEVSDPAEGSVEWSKAQQHMLGADPDGEPAGDDAAQPEAAKQPREFKYRGKTVSVDAETYEVLEGLRREARGANGRLGSELARTRERLAKLEGMVTSRPSETRAADEIKPPDPLLATRDIAAWQAQYDAYHAAKTEQKLRELEERHSRSVRENVSKIEQAEKDKIWASRFYENYDYLDDDAIKPIVAQVYQEHAAELEALKESSDDAAYEHLADLTDKRLVRLKNVGKEVTDTNTNPRRPPRIESSAGPTPRQKAEAPKEEFSAGRWVAQQRQRMAGRAPKK